MQKKSEGELFLMGKRNLGIDLLKLLSMYMVVILHILSYSGLLEQTLPGGTPSGCLKWRHTAP